MKIELELNDIQVEELREWGDAQMPDPHYFTKWPDHEKVKYNTAVFYAAMVVNALPPRPFQAGDKVRSLSHSRNSTWEVIGVDEKRQLAWLHRDDILDVIEAFRDLELVK